MKKLRSGDTKLTLEQRRELLSDGKKQCPCCLNIKPVKEFFLRNSAWDKAAHRCKLCVGQDPSKRAARLLKIYGLTLEEYNSHLERQGFGCAICKTNQAEYQTKTGRKLTVDHCHSTGKIRGILCNKCNRGLALFNDNPELLTRAAEYLI